MSARQFVSRFQNLLKKGKSLKAAQVSVKALPKIPTGAPKVLIFSPHPDDECIVGGLALRLLREVKWNVTNVAVTLGSKTERRAARLRELQNACKSLGFRLIVAGGGLERITPESRKQNRTHWKSAVRTVAQILAGQRPRVIFLPHDKDWHPAHIWTH
jgi:N-acetylglucosamine malate deacetylase 1